MSRTLREAKLKAIYGDKYGDVLVTELGGRKRDRKKMLQDVMLHSYRSGSLSRGTQAPVQSSTPAWAGLTTQGAPQAQQNLMNPEQRYIPPALKNMTSYGNRGNMFAGSSAGPAGNPFSTGGGAVQMPSAPKAAPAPRSGPDFYGLRTPGMGQLRAPVQQAPQAPPPAATPNWGAGTGQFTETHDPYGYRVGSAESRARYSPRGMAVSGSTPAEMTVLRNWLQGQNQGANFRKGTLPGYAGGTLSEDFFRQFGTGPAGGSAIGVARGSSPGVVNPLLAGRSNEELAELDRLQFNRQVTGQNPLAGLVGAAGLTALDLAKSTGVQNRLGPVIRALGGSEAAAREWAGSERTSKPSLRQALSNLRGFGMGVGDIASAFRSD